MRAASSLPKIAALALLGGCSSASISTAPMAPQIPASAARVHGPLAPPSATRGIYAGFDGSGTGPSVYGYAGRNPKNKPPVCSAVPNSIVGDIAVDKSRNLMVTSGSNEVFVLQGPQMCGPLLGQINTNGIAYDVASADAANGQIVVGNVYGNTTGAGNIAVCTLSGGCTKTLTNSNILALYGVALANNGDCWAAATTFSGSTTAVLVYFKHCSGAGQLAAGFMNGFPGGLDIDKHGNLVSIDGEKGVFYVYQGCRPACTLVGGPFAAHGYGFYGHLNKNSTEFVAADSQYGQIDVYKYTPTKMTYEYSFNNGISAGATLISAAYVPRSRE